MQFEMPFVKASPLYTHNIVCVWYVTCRSKTQEAELSQRDRATLSEEGGEMYQVCGAELELVPVSLLNFFLPADVTRPAR